MKVLLDKNIIKRSVTRICYEIIEKNSKLENLILIGIQSRGDLLAKRIASRIAELEGHSIPVEVLDISYFRDDVNRDSFDLEIKKFNFLTDLNKKNCIIVDDVLFTGRTVRAALDAILSKARPDKVQLCCLIDRGHRELPIRADYIGKNIPTSRQEIIKVFLDEEDGKEEVVLIKKEEK